MSVIASVTVGGVPAVHDVFVVRYDTAPNDEVVVKYILAPLVQVIWCIWLPADSNFQFVFQFVNDAVASSTSCQTRLDTVISATWPFVLLITTRDVADVRLPTYNFVPTNFPVKAHVVGASSTAYLLKGTSISECTKSLFVSTRMIRSTVAVEPGTKYKNCPAKYVAV